jgi:hypothetical protein
MEMLVPLTLPLSLAFLLWQLRGLVLAYRRFVVAQNALAWALWGLSARGGVRGRNAHPTDHNSLAPSTTTRGGIG